jgi:peptidoglycan endopeptidase LytE
MKNIKRFMALVIALMVLTTPTFAFVGCKEDNTATLPTPPVQEETEEIPPPIVEQPPVQEEEQTPPVVAPTPPTTESKPTVTPASTKIQYVRCTGNNVNLRSGAGTEYAVIGQAQSSDSFAVLEKKDGWYKIYHRGKVAYIYAAYASVFTLEKSNDEDVEDVLNEGYKLMGVPYVYGAVRLHDGKGNLLKGFTAQKFDCSSLVQYIFYKGADELLDVTTRLQSVQGKPVKKADLKRGDCIYFTNESRKHLTGVERIGHVAVYLGDNYILHTASDYARIEKISATRWSYYIEARRFI